MSAIASAWALDVDAGTPTNKLVLLVLADRHNKDTGKCCPSISMIAKDTLLSESSVKRSVRALESLGLLKRETRKRSDRSNTTNQYVLNITGTITACHPATGAPLEPEVEPEEDQDLAKPAAPRERNPVWDALQAVTGFEPTTRSEASDFGKTVSELRAVIPKNATPEQIEQAMRARRRQFERRFPGAEFTHRVLRSKWGELAARLPATAAYPELPDGEEF